MLRVALVLASSLVRAGLEAGLDGFEIVLSCATWVEADSAEFGHADVAIVDAADETDVYREGPPLVLLVRAEHPRVAECLSEGVSVLPADAPVETIVAAALAAARGLVAATPGLMTSALRFGAGVEQRAEQPEIEPLTARELEVLAKLMLGLANREIAEELRISTHTAKFHVAQIIAKLDAKSRAHAVAKAMHAGIV